MVDGSSHVLIAFADFSPCECLVNRVFFSDSVNALNPVGCFLDWSVREKVN